MRHSGASHCAASRQPRFGSGLRCRFCLLRYSGGQLASKRHYASSSRLEELLDLHPISSDHVVCADVPTTLNGFQSRSCEPCEFSGTFIGNVRIVLGVEHQHLGTLDFLPAVPRIVEGAASELPPIRIGKPITIAKRFADIVGVILVAGFDFFGSVQNRPVHYGTICDYPAHPWVKGCKDCCRAPEASPDDEDLVRP